MDHKKFDAFINELFKVDNYLIRFDVIVSQNVFLHTNHRTQRTTCKGLQS